MTTTADIIHNEVIKDPAPRWAKSLLDYSQPLPPAPPALVSINGTDVAFRGGITAIAGADKSGKSTLIRLVLASALSGKSIFGVKTKPVRICDFDTEQPTFRVLRLIDNAFRLAERERTKDPSIFVLELRPYTPAERWQAVEETIEDLRPDLVILDGVTDLIADINDLTASADLIARLLTIATDFDLSILCLIHTNPNDPAGKLRGHLGSEIMRKAETSILLDKSDAGVFTCRCKASRGKPFDAFSFMKDADDNLIPVDAPIKAVGAPDKLLQAMEPGRKYSYSDLVNIGIEQGATTSSAKYAITRNCQAGKIEKDGKDYVLKTDPQVSQFSLI